MQEKRASSVDVTDFKRFMGKWYRMGKGQTAMKYAVPATLDPCSPLVSFSPLFHQY